MGTLIDMRGQRFGWLVVEQKSDRISHAGALWVCRCDCGSVSVVGAGKLRSGKIVSCGCYRAQNLPNLKHGHANRTLAYRTWKEMRQRCNNPNATQYKWYGGRGIAVCARWDSYENFLSDMGDRLAGTTLDRIDPDKDYAPENCRWATAKEQAATNRGVFQPGLVPWNKKVKGVSK